MQEDSKTTVDIVERTYRSLEWERLKLFLSNCADSICGKEACLSIQLSDQRDYVEQLLDETDEALSLLKGRSGLAVGGLPDLREILPRLEIGASLSGQELVAVRSVLLTARQFRSSLSLLPAESFPRLHVYAGALPLAEAVIVAIENAIDEIGNVKDEASSLLRQLRREMHRIDASIKETLLKIIHSSTLSKALTEPLYTQRGGRYVLPVNASMRSAIGGIVHDSSASGLTVYVEPMAVLELSNKLRMKETELEREVARILAELSLLCASNASKIQDSFDTVIALDVIMARARLASKYNGIRPELSQDAEFNFIKARHPLLLLQDQSKVVVANDISLGGRLSRTLVITGPNTGGKTVLLKLVGLFALMIRAGLLLPVSEGSSAALYTHVCADVGDEQSLEQSLSTFSSHMQNIVEITNNCGPGWLVLLDEVGAGTDPREGAALARAILEFLNQSGAVTISTTHYGELKTLAYTEAGFLNGSLDFDDESLSPTYRLRLGVPGSSQATTIAKRLGLNDTVIRRARELVEVRDQDLQRTIDQLEVSLKEAQDREEKADTALHSAQELEAEAGLTMKEAEQLLATAKAKQAREVEHEYQLGRDYIKHLIADLQKQPSINKAQKVQHDLERVKAELGWDDLQSGKTGAKAAPQLVIGQTVRVLSLNQRGIVADLPAELANHPAALIGVRCGAMKVKVPASDLEIIGHEGSAGKGASSRTEHLSASKKQKFSAHTAQKVTPPRALEVFVRNMVNTLDLRGQRVDDAISNLERFLDDSFSSGVSPVMIIHGHGTGAVRNAVRETLRTSNYANSFKSGEHQEGGDGVTIVQL